MNIEIETHAFVDPLLFSFEKMRLEKIGNSGTKPVINEILLVHDLQQHLATAGEITQQE